MIGLIIPRFSFSDFVPGMEISNRIVHIAIIRKLITYKKECCEIMDEKTYQKSLDYLYSFIDYSLTRNLRYAEEKFDLSRMATLMDLLGNPQKDFDIIHVAGTKGKGSTCAMIFSILRSQGYHVGFYSSPHMIDFTERIRVNNHRIPPDDFCLLLDDMKEVIEKVKSISTFEITTALAFQYFSKKEIDIAVVEVGMGGRLDATNIVTPILSVITSISLDHTKILGNTITKIAEEKAGIIKKGVPVIISKQKKEAKKVLLNIAAQKRSPCIDVTQNYKWEQLDYSLACQKFRIRKINDTQPKNGNEIMEIRLLGDHQLDNALTTFTVINNLPNRYDVTRNAIIEGFKNVIWPGRFEVLSEAPLIIIDGAHNPDSFLKLSLTLQKYLPGKKTKLIFGVSEDKDFVKMIQIIQPFVESIVFTKSDHPRALSKKEMEAKIIPLLESKFVYRDITEIVQEIKKDKEGVYIATGSIFIAGAVKQLFQK